MSTLASFTGRASGRQAPDPALGAGRAAGPGPRQKREFPFALACSAAVHVLLAAWLVTHSGSKGVRRPQIKTTVVISLESLREIGKPRATSPEAAPASPQPAAKAAAVPDAQAMPKPRRQPVPPKTAQAAAVPPNTRNQAPAAHAPQNLVPTPAEKRGNEGESLGITLLNQVRTNWLKPVGSSPSFHCRLRIDYLAGGFIANVVVLNGCGANPLDDSVERAVWKTQPLPLDPAQSGPGSVVLEFSP